MGRTLSYHLITLICAGQLTGAQAADKGPADGTVLIIRHAEKPPKDDPNPGLTDTGTDRAKKYVTYFQPFRDGSKEIAINAIFAAKDSDESIRPRKTVERVAAALNVPFNTEIKNKKLDELISALESPDLEHKKALLCWHHGEIPTLLGLFGADATKLLGPDGWPDKIFGWVVILHFDQTGALASARVVNEGLEDDDRDPPKKVS